MMNPPTSGGPDGYAELPDADRQIIELLQVDGRRSFRQIASELGVTEKTIRHRVAHLREANVIDITAVTRPAFLSYTGLATVGCRLANSASVSETAAELSRHEMVDYVAVVAGRFQIFVEVYARDRKELLAFLDGELGTMQAIESYEVFPYLELFYQEGLTPDPPSGLSDNGAPPNLDRLDFRVIQQLTEDGRMPVRTMAGNLGVSEARIRHRLHSLIDRDLVRVTAILNPIAVGLRTAAWVRIRVRPGSGIRRVARLLVDLPSVTYVTITSGDADIFVEVVCSGLADFGRIVDDELHGNPGIDELEAFLYLELHYTRPRYSRASFPSAV
jgi:DNA-binding Lrp family transcriptional regulator